MSQKKPAASSRTTAVGETVLGEDVPEFPVARPTCPTAEDYHNFLLTTEQEAIVKAFRSAKESLTLEFDDLRKTSFRNDGQATVHLMRYRYSAINSFSDLCDLHMALSHSGNTARDALKAAVKFHRQYRCCPVGPDRDAVRDNHRPIRAVEVLGRVSAGWHEGVISWADAHAAALERVAGFPVSPLFTTRDDYPPKWENEVLKKVFDELHQNPLGQFFNAIRSATAPPAAPSIDKNPVDDVAETIKRVALMLGEDGGKIMAIVSHSEFKTDQKLRSLAKLDERFRGYKSKDLAELLRVSQASIRNGNVWKEWNPKSTKREKLAK